MAEAHFYFVYQELMWRETHNSAGTHRPRGGAFVGGPLAMDAQIHKHMPGSYDKFLKINNIHIKIDIRPDQGH